MNKLSVLLVMLLLVSGALMADISQYYTFENATGTYTAITGTTITGINGDDAISAAIPIGFSFSYGLNAYTDVKVCSNGWVGLGSAQTSTAYTNQLVSTSVCPIVAPYWDDLDGTNAIVSYLSTGTAPNRIFTVQYASAVHLGGSDNLNFQVSLFENGKVELAYGTATGLTTATASMGINMLPGGATNYWSVTPGTPATASNTTENSSVSTWPAAGVIYRFNPPVAVPNDMAAMSITGNTTPSVGTASNYTVNVRNAGTAASVAYTVKLMNGTTELASVTGPALAAGLSQDVVIPWTPAATGTVAITGKVVAPGDQNAQNDQTAPLSVNVQGAGTIVVTVGAGDQAARMPVDMYWKNSLFETVYLASELNIGGALTGVAFYNNFTTNLPNMPVNIWMANTAVADLSAGWIPSTQMTQVFTGTVTFPSGPNTIIINFPTPFAYTGGNLAMMVQRPMDTQYYSSTDNFQCQTVGTARSLNLYSDTVTYDPAAPATATPSGQFPKTSFYFIVGGMGTLSGTVNAGGSPLANATLTLATATPMTQQTTATGAYSFPFVQPGTYQLTCSKVGYASQTVSVTLVADQTTTQNFVMVALPQVTVTGTVTGSDQPTVGLADASVTLTGMVDYTATTNAAGQFTIPNVYSNQAYNYTITKAGYQNGTGTVNVGATNHNMGTITLNEIALPAAAVQAAANTQGTVVNVVWSAPGTAGGEWIQRDTGENDDSIGLTNGGAFDVASRWTADELADYVGMSLHAVKFFCGDVATFSIRVWTGGNATAPGQLVADQAIATVTADEWITVNLATPVPIAAGQELWFGYSVTHTAGLYPAGTDGGPAHNGFGNMIYFNNAWNTLYNLSSSLNYDWNLAGYVGFGAPTRIAQLQPLTFDTARYNTNSTLASSGKAHKIENATVIHHTDEIRVLEGYKVWRLLQGQETNEAAWTQLTPNTITATAYSDGGWATVPDGTYKWAVKATYTNNVLAAPAFSNPVQKLTQVGTIQGIVRNVATNQPISGATVATGTYTATSNTSGAYSLTVPAGTHVVTCSATGYTTATQNGVVVVTGQTTNLNFNLAVATTVNDGFETYANFAITFAPWTNVDVDQSATYGHNTVDWENEYAAQAFMVFNPSATTPSSVDGIGPTHAGDKMAVCWAAETPPNDDWLISPLYSNVGQGAAVSFWARSMTDQWGLERFKVGISTGATTPASFTFVSGATYVSAPLAWTQYNYDIPATYVGQNIRIGIQCVSNDAFCFQVDDYQINLGVANDDPAAPVVTTALNGAYPNPFNPNTTISFSVKNASPVTIEIYNSKGQKVKTLVNETKAQGNHSASWNGKDDNGNNVTSGVYFYKMTAGKFSSSKKMILMK